MATFDFDPGGGRVRENVQLLDPHPRQGDARVYEAGFSDPLGQGFDQPDMAGRHDAPNRGGELFVVHHPGQIVSAHGGAGQRAGAVILHAQIDVDADALRREVLRRMHADVDPQLRRMQNQLDNIETALNLAIASRYAELSQAPWPSTVPAPREAEPNQR